MIAPLERKTHTRRLPSEPVCITDPRRGRREFFIRLETWLAREVYESLRAGRGLEAELIFQDLHYARHLRTHRPPCPMCRVETIERLRG